MTTLLPSLPHPSWIEIQIRFLLFDLRLDAARRHIGRQRLQMLPATAIERQHSAEQLQKLASTMEAAIEALK